MKGKPGLLQPFKVTFFCPNNNKITVLLRLAGTPGDCLLQPPAQIRFGQIRLLRTTSSPVLNISKDGKYCRIFSKQSVSMFEHLHSKKGFFMLKNFLCFRIKSLCLKMIIIPLNKGSNAWMQLQHLSSVGYNSQS